MSFERSPCVQHRDLSPSRGYRGFHRCQGFLLPAAVFLVVILSSLAAFLLNISSSQHIGSAQDVIGARAYHAARSGLEWGFYHTLVPPIPEDVECPLEENVPLDTTAFPNMSLTVRCEDVSAGATEAGEPVTLYQITATACSEPNSSGLSCPNLNPGLMYVERKLQAVVER
jgi:MSHA biogenesis protein MshP